MKIPKGQPESANRKKDRQHNGQKKKVQKDKQRSTKTTQKTKDRAKRNPLKPADELMCPGVAVPTPLVTPVHATIKRDEHYLT